MGYFFFASAPGRLQLPGLQSSECLGLESALRLFVERESAKCHSYFCPLVFQALPAGETDASGQIRAGLGWGARDSLVV